MTKLIRSWNHREDLLHKDFIIFPVFYKYWTRIKLMDRNHWSLSVICQPIYLKEYIAAEATVFGIDYSPIGEDQYYNKKKAVYCSKEQENFIQKLSNQIHEPLNLLTTKEKMMLFDASVTKDPLIVYKEFIEAKQRHIEKIKTQRRKLEVMPKLLVFFGIPIYHSHIFF